LCETFVLNGFHRSQLEGVIVTPSPEPTGVPLERERVTERAEDEPSLSKPDPAWPEPAAFDRAGQTTQQVVSTLRQITRAIDLHSRSLWTQCGLTSPQLAALLAISHGQPITAGHLARQLHLGQPTVSGILDRLERQAFVQRERGERDRRSVLLRLTAAGQEVVNGAPTLLHGFCQQLAELEPWERTQILSNLQRVASMIERSIRSHLPPVTEVLKEQRQLASGQQVF
jgi:DNA-binding MarR family transcriptional regulator